MKRIYWTDMHSNMHSNQIHEMDQWYEEAKKNFDFWPIAYYPFYMRKDACGLGVEDRYPDERVAEDWEAVRDLAKRAEKEGFPFFMGYEWQGAGLDGDHNVYYLNNDQDTPNPMRYEGLVEDLPIGKALAIPHHLAYQLGSRGKNWATHNEVLSPFVEIYSSHGCSENDLSPLSMERHIHMGPRTEGTHVEAGLDAGYKVGIIAAGDNHQYPGVYGHGLMAVVAENNDKESIWRAMRNRHVYGVTGDRIELMMFLDQMQMGDEIPVKDKYLLDLRVKGSSAIDRIELLQDNVVRKVFVHSGVWERQPLPEVVRFKCKIEFGWGPDRRVFEDIDHKVWSGKVETETGKILSVEKQWTNYGQEVISQTEKELEFQLTTYKSTATGKWMGPSPVGKEGFVLEIEDKLDAEITFAVEGKNYRLTVAEILARTHLYELREEVEQLLKERFGFTDYYRDDPFWHNAYKFKVHRGIPESGYCMEIEKELQGDFHKGSQLRVRVYQKNGHMAWSSPIFIR